MGWTITCLMAGVKFDYVLKKTKRDNACQHLQIFELTLERKTLVITKAISK